MANRWQLQDGSGLWLLQDGSGYWLLQDSVAGDDIVAVDSGTASEQSATLADGLAVETGSLSEARTGSLDAIAPDAGALAEASLGLVDTAGTDPLAQSESQVTLRVDFPNTLETFTLSESAVGELGSAQDNVVAADSGALAEIELLLAELNATDELVFSDTVNEPVPPLAQLPDAERPSATSSRWRPEEEIPDEDEELALAGYVCWYS